jgi:AP-1 complex subunit sigma 1/2
MIILGMRTRPVRATYSMSLNLIASCRIFNFQKAYAVREFDPHVSKPIAHRNQILDELIISGELQESSKKSVLRVVCDNCDAYGYPSQRLFQVAQADAIEETENEQDAITRLGSRLVS